MSTALRRTIWWIRDYAYAAGWQIRGALSRIPADAFHSGNRNPIVVIPGVYENWQFMLPLITALHQAGHPVHVVTLLQRNRLDVPIAARLVAEHIAAAGLNNAVILAHSKGGLIGKYIMLALDPDRRIDRMVAVCIDLIFEIYLICKLDMDLEPPHRSPMGGTQNSGRFWILPWVPPIESLYCTRYMMYFKGM